MGIWIYPRPLLINDTHVYLLDSEGSAALAVDDAHDKRLQMLVWNLSSIILYNSLHSIDERAITELSLICTGARMLQDAIQSSSDKVQLSKDAPNFIWVVRDTAVNDLLAPETKKIVEAPEYMELTIRSQNQKSSSISTSKKRKKQEEEQEEDGETEMETDCDRNRTIIRNAFCNERWCIMLPRPTSDDKLPFVSSLDDSELAPMFVEGSKQLQHYISDRSSS